MPETSEISTGEIARGLALIRDDIKDLAEKVELRPDWEDVRRVEAGLEVKIAAEAATRAAERAVLDKALGSLEDWNTWAVRIVLGAIGTGALGGILTFTAKL